MTPVRQSKERLSTPDQAIDEERWPLALAAFSVVNPLAGDAKAQDDDRSQF